VNNIEIVLFKDFQKAAQSLSKASKIGKDAATKALAACTRMKLEGESGLPFTHHGESRMDGIEKYDLGQGYRLVTLRVSSDPAVVVMLYVGSHADADAC